ncbi:MAG TPA: KH domain-containing protein, partial [Candidatus Elarobacter sp.]
EVDTDKGPVVELVVEHEDLGKVIGRNGRVAQALRTLVRASAEGRLSIDIISFEDEVVEGTSEAGADIGRSAGSGDPGDDDDDAATGDAAATGDPAPAATGDAVAASDVAADGADGGVAAAPARPAKRSRKTEK